MPRNPDGDQTPLEGKREEWRGDEQNGRLPQVKVRRKMGRDAERNFGAPSLIFAIADESSRAVARDHILFGTPLRCSFPLSKNAEAPSKVHLLLGIRLHG